MRVTAFSYHISFLQEYCGQVLLVIFYRWKKKQGSENKCLAELQVELSLADLYHSCFLNTWINICSPNKDNYFLLQSPHYPCLPHCLPTENFLRLFVEVNRTFLFYPIASALTAVNCWERRMQLSVFFIYFRIKNPPKQKETPKNKSNKQTKHQYALTEPCD